MFGVMVWGIDSMNILCMDISGFRLLDAHLLISPKSHRFT